MPALFTIKQAALGQVPKLIVTTSRTGKAHRPSLFGQMLDAILLRRKRLLKTQQTPLFVLPEHPSVTSDGTLQEFRSCVNRHFSSMDFRNFI